MRNYLNFNLNCVFQRFRAPMPLLHSLAHIVVKTSNRISWSYCHYGKFNWNIQKMFCDTEFAFTAQTYRQTVSRAFRIFFSAFRYQASYNNNPNTKLFESSSKYLLVYAQIKTSDCTNWKPQDDICLLQKSNSDIKYVFSYKSLCDTDEISMTKITGESNFYKDIVSHPTVEHHYCIPREFADVNLGHR